MTNPIKIVMLLDSSGSMGVLKNETIQAFNSFIASQKELDGEATFSLYNFGSAVNSTEAIDIKKVQDLNVFSYRPSGGTALYDAIGKAISVEVKSGTSGVLAILTDGEENSSRLFKKEQIATMIKDIQDINGWQVIFLGANITNFTEFTASINILPANSIGFEYTSKGLHGALNSISASTTAYRTSH